MMLDWEGYRKELLGRIADLGRLTPQTVRGYRDLSDAGNKTAHLDAKTRELIAIAVGVTRQCDGCITTHVHAAKRQGATKEEIAEALGVAIAVNAGAALVFSRASWMRSRLRRRSSGRKPYKARSRFLSPL